MKILNTKSGKFGHFIRKNGGFFVLGLVILATCIAVYAGADRLNKIPIADNNSDTNLSKDDSNWVNSQNAQQTDVQNTSSSQQSSQQQYSSQSSSSSSSDYSQEQSSSQNSEQILFLLPVNGDVLNKYSGDKQLKNETMGDWRLHTGIDYAAKEGTTVKASGAGKVSKIYNDAMWGTTVEIEHDGNITTVYSSLSEKVFVEKGQSVESGQAIATVGNTAKIELSEKSHLHFAVKKNGKYINPESIITRPIE